jgi:hypothetical protein
VGLWLVSEGVVLLSLRSEDRGMGESLALEVMAHERTRAERALAEIGQLMRGHLWSRSRRATSPLLGVSGGCRRTGGLTHSLV